MCQVRVRENVYFQQAGEFIDGCYVNEDFVRIKVGRKLNESELEELANKLMAVCDTTEAISNVIKNYEKEYKENPNRDGFVLLCR